MTAMKSVLIAIALAVLGAVALGGAAQDPHRPSPPPLAIKSTYGADLYQFYCSSCHGATARGGAARSPHHPPAPDLTALPRQNAGTFPRERVRASITFGPGAAGHGAHGTADMPVWGTVFRGLDRDDTMTAIRIENLVNYLASLQEREKGQ
jgi:mono/diheme cytochrome c family protein